MHFYCLCSAYNHVAFPIIYISEMLEVEALPEAEHVLEKIEAYPWHVDTKYYTADVRLCTTDTRTIGDEEFANSVQALVLIFDSKKVWITH